MELIQKLSAREILDSRGNPTVEVELETERAIARASVPSGASTGIHEALELRDHDKKRYNGLGVKKAAEYVNTLIRNEFVHQDISILSQKQADSKLIEIDGTPNKSKLGANAILGVSWAFAKAKAFSYNMTLYQYLKSIMPDIPSPLERDKTILPVPMMNIVNGGKHADSGLDFQEFLIIPAGAPTFAEALRYGSEIFHMLKNILAKKGLMTSVGDEGGFAPKLRDNEEVFHLIMEAIEKAGYKAGQDIFIAMDAAASSFYDTKNKVYTLHQKGTPVSVTTQQLHDYYVRLRKSFPLISIEDPFAEDDWEGFTLLMQTLGSNTQIMGDDLFVTNIDRIKKGIERKAANASLIKPNQIGTITETMNAIGLAYKHTWTAVISHRSGETEDPCIADLAVGAGTGQIKTGSLSRSERIAKYNQLLRIGEREGENAWYAGLSAFYNITL